MEYQKRPGTSGIDGQLYETKLLALILFRLQHDRTVQYFHLATNINDFGDFDDICLVVKIEGHDRPVAVFVQLKHKENDKVVIKFNNKDKVKYINSFIKIMKRVATRQPWDQFFDGNLTETDCLFILYTNAKFNITNLESKLENSYATVLNSLLATSDTVACWAQDSDQFVQDLADYFLKNDLVLLSEHFAEFLIDKGNDRSMQIMNDEYIQQYHLILRRKVVDVSDIRIDEHEQDLKWRTLTFQQDFFTTDDKYLLIFREQLFKELLKKQRERLFQESITSGPLLDETISVFLSAPSPATLTPLIITHIDSNEVGRLEFLIKRPSCDIELLQQINMSPNEIDEAILAVKTSVIEYLMSLELKVPITFGNVDLVIRGNENKINRRLKYLTTAIVGLCKEYEQQESYNIVQIDDRLDDGLLSYNGGLASAVGNMFTYDEKTNMLKFSNDLTSEQKIAKKFFLNLEKRIDDIFNYRFVVKTKKFPKLHCDCTDTAREFLTKLIIYEKQSNHWQVEDILKEKIQERLSADSRNLIMKSSETCVSVFLHYHEEILKWWISPTTGTYLNKTSNLYERAIYNMEAEPQISALQTMFYISKAKYFGLSFTRNTMKWMELPDLPSKVFIATDIVALTTVKVIQCLRSYFLINKFAVLDFEFVLNMPIADFNSLNAEVRKTEKVLIIVWHKTPNNSDTDNRLPTFALATKEKQLVIIINKEFKEKVKEHFFNTRDVFFDEAESLSNIKSQKEIIKDAKIIFQDQEICLDNILDDESVSFVKGGILDKVIRNETINISKPLSNTQYEEVKDLYIDRNVVTNTPVDDIDEVNDYVNIKRRMSSDDDAPSDYDHCISNEFKIYVEYTNVYTKVILVKTFLDIQNDVVLLAAAPGMGKSTLLTHLSINTNEHNAKLWIVRVNFIDYSQQFKEWYNDEIVVNALECLNFLCQVIVSNNTISFGIEITNGEAHLVSCTGDELTDFKLNMFLHFYNHRRLILVFDGCDEICPDFKDKVISFLTVAKTDLRKYKMWVTSRPYSNILPDLEIVLGKRFQLKSLSFTEQETYLKRFWNKKLLFRKPTDKQIQNLLTFIKNSRESILEADNWVRTIYSVFVDTVRPLYCQSISDAEIDELNTILKSSRRTDPSRNVQILSGNPLLLYFLADYFVNITATATNRSKSISEFNLHNVYEIFIENKLKTVLFEDKNKMDLSKISTRRLLEKELYNCINIHKKLAAYIFYQSLISNKLDFEEFKDMKPLNEKEFYTELDNIKTGTEKTGLISHVTAANVPVFIHGSFLEYLIAEYTCDILKSNKYPVFQKTLWYYAIIAGGYTAVKDWIEKKKKTDPTFRHAFEEMEKRSPIYKTIYHVYFNRENMSKRQYVRILASSVNDYEDGCFSDYDEFLSNYLFEISEPVRKELKVYFQNYFISKMKPYLKQHFGGPTIFKIQCKNAKFLRDLRVFQVTDKNEGIFLKIKIKNERSTPLLTLLIHQDHCDAFQTSNTEIMKKNCHKLATDDVGETDFVCIQFSGVLVPRYNSSFLSEINKFLATASIIGNRLHYSEQHVKDFAEKMLENELALFDIVYDFDWKENCDLSIDMMLAPGYINLTFLKYIKPYHVILRQHVFDITDIQTDKKKSGLKWRTGTFQDKFFYTNDRHIALLRNRLFQQILSIKANNILSRREDNILRDQLIPFFLSEPSVTTLTLLLGTYIVSDEDNKLKFLIERPPSDVEQLRHISIPQSTFDEAKFAVRTAVMVYLQSIQFKAPIDFGNIDLTHGYLPDTEMNIGQLKNAIVKLCEESTPHKVVTIDDTLDENLLRGNGGLASCVGNILIYDEETEMLKFSNLHQFTTAQENAKSLYLQLSHEIDNLHEYRFDVKTEKLPKCHLDYTKTAREFLGRLVIFAQQSNHYDVEEISNQADEDREKFKDFQIMVQSKLVSLHCHAAVLKWWRTSTAGECDTKPYDLFQQAMINIKAEPIISYLHSSFYLNNLKYFGYIFNANVTKSMEKPAIRSKLLIVTETVILTTIKVLQLLKSSSFNNEYAVLDAVLLCKYLDLKDSSLRKELRNTTKVLIIVCTQRSDDDTLHELAQLSEHKRMVIISNNEFRATVESHCEWSDVVFNNEIESLSTIHSHKQIMRDTKVIFQGQNVSLDVIVDNESVAYVKGDVLDKVINNDIIHIGKVLSNSQYNKIKDLLVDRRVGPVWIADDEYEISSEVKVIKTFYDIVNDVVLLAAPTGMGKSTLLTHLALNTTEHDGKLWIVRVNFTEYVEQFNKWQDEDTYVNALESFKFLCQVTLNNKITSFNVAFTHDKAHLESCTGDGLATFELNLFLHFYNERRVMFVFDGVGEIDPYCKDKVVNFLTVVNTRLRKNKMWVTSRSDSAILSDLQTVLGEGFKIEC